MYTVKANFYLCEYSPELKMMQFHPFSTHKDDTGGSKGCTDGAVIWLPLDVAMECFKKMPESEDLIAGLNSQTQNWSNGLKVKNPLHTKFKFSFEGKVKNQFDSIAQVLAVHGISTCEPKPLSKI